MFDAIAPRYDLLNHLLSFNIDRRWRRRTVRMAKQVGPSDILDMATGTGDLAIDLARHLPMAHITGIDISDKMLCIAREKIHRCRLDGRIELLQGDAERTPFPASCFDVITVAFGVRNFQCIAAGLSESVRLLRTGGRLFILEFSTPQGKIFGPIYRFYFHRVLPIVGGIISGERSAYEYLPDSVSKFPEKSLFLRQMTEAGLDECHAVTLMNGVAYIYTGQKK